MHRNRNFALAVVAALALTCFVAAPAMADPGQPGLNDAASAVYPNTDTNNVLGTGGEGTGATATDPGAPGSLPFTGFVAPILLAVGLGSIAVGLSLRQARARSSRLA